MESPKRCFTVTVYPVYKGRVLLHFHKKLHQWIPVGGHVDPGETPDEAAVRELKEESGLQVDFSGKGAGEKFAHYGETLMRPDKVILQNIDIPGHDQHIDFAYYVPALSDELAPEEGESKELRWFKEDELEALDAPKNVPVLAKEAIRSIK